MKVDPNPKICKPNEKSSNDSDDPCTFYTKYIFRDQPDDCAEMDSRTVPHEDITDEFDQVLRVKAETQSEPLSQPVPLKLVNEQFPRILFLGTSSADSIPLRNSTGILVHLS